MAHKKDYKPEDIMFPEQRIVQSELVHEMKSSYIDYAMSVIVGRALPDVRDGLKPVHRRILYAMYEDNLTSDKPFKKSATCVSRGFGKIISPSFVASNPANAAAAAWPLPRVSGAPVPNSSAPRRRPSTAPGAWRPSTAS